MTKSRKNFDAAFKAKVALEALREDSTVPEQALDAGRAESSGASPHADSEPRGCSRAR